MGITMVPNIIKSMAFSISIYFLVCSLINIKLKSSQFIRYILATSMPLILLSFYYALSSTTYNFLSIIVSSSLLSFLVSKVIFKMNYKDIIIPTLIAYTVYQLVLNDYCTMLSSLGIYNLTLTNPIYQVILFNLIVTLTTIALSYAFKKYLNSNLLTNNLYMIDTKLYFFISGFLLFLISLSSYLNSYYISILGSENTFAAQATELSLNIFFVATLALLYFTLQNYFNKQAVEVKNLALDEVTKNLEELNKDLRSQKHDFFNHLQVISGMLQLKKYNECFNYVVGVYNTDQSHNAIRTGLISINALLNSKQLRAKHQNVIIDFDIATELDNSKFKIEDWEITKVLGNLIDNAVFEETKVSSTDKYVKVKIGEDDEHYSFSVYNKNSFIDHDKRNKIFCSGFSTKGKDGHGMGLYIVKNIVDKHKGKIHLESHIGSGTRFSLYFPKSAELIENQFSQLKSYPPQESLNTQTN